MLHDPERHEPLRATPWDAATARRAIDAIVEDSVRRFDPTTYWASHPLDLEPDELPDLVTTPLYHGACGVAWGLRHLASRGHAAPRPVALDVDTLLVRNRDWLKRVPTDARASYLMGDTPIRLLAFDATPTEAIALELERLIASNVDNPTREFLWGSPGTLLAALFLHEKTADERWAASFRRTAQVLWDQLRWSDTRGCWSWSQDLYGRRSTYLGAGHGFVGNVLPLIRGRHLLPDWSAWEVRIVETISRSALREGGLANWSAELEPSDRPAKRFVQWCHGAAGVVVALGALPPGALDALLLEAGETTWVAGPLTKGAGLCHGTGGNGYAFLKLHRRTGEARWLERARAFAMHGIAQVAEARARHGQSRHSLWTGDIGFAIFLADCLDGSADFPTLDVFWTSGSR